MSDWQEAKARELEQAIAQVATLTAKLSAETERREKEESRAERISRESMNNLASFLARAETAEANCLKAIDEREHWYGRADALASLVGEHFDVSVGEWSNLNDPVSEATLILNGAYVTKYAKLEADAQRLREVAEAYKALDEQRAACEDCKEAPEMAAETCPLCFSFADRARLLMRAAFAPGEGQENG